MKRTLQLLFVVALVFGTLGLSAVAQEAPAGVFYGAWPYYLPPDGHLNSFATGGPNSNGLYYKWAELPMAFYIAAEGDYEPWLAEDWGFEGEEAFFVKLREDAVWSDGNPVMADDLVGTYAIGRILKWSDFNYVGDIEKVDDYTVRFVLDDPALVVRHLILRTSIRSMATYGELAAKAMEMYESGEEVDSDAWQELQAEIKEYRPEALVVSGPFTYTLDDIGDSFMTMYWQPGSIFSDAVNFGEVKIWYGETEAVTPLVLDGQVSYATHGFPPSTEQAFVEAGLRIVRGPYGYGASVYFNHDVYPWSLPEVRQAAAMVIDRSENAFLTKGLSAVPVHYMAGMADNLVELWLDEADIAELNSYEYDPDAAEELLLSIGFSRDDDGMWLDDNGDPVQAEYIFQAEWADYSAAAQNAVDQLNEFGFDISGRAVQWQQLDEDLKDGNFELSVRSWGASSPFPSSQWNGPLRSWNYTGLETGRPGINFPMQLEWNGEEVDYQQLIADAGAGLDTEAQKPYVAKAAKIFNAMLPVVPLSEAYSNNPVNEDLLTNVPADDDPIWLNGGGSTDNYITYLVMNGVLAPGQ
jgi:peptide/nickel transport system substrate-binding protein